MVAIKDKFRIYGPFPVPQRDRSIDRSKRRAFWKSVDEKVEDLSQAVGCYVFAKKDRGYKPWYVGMTTGNNYKGECLNDRNQLLLNPLLRKRGTLVLFLLPKVTPKTDMYAAAGSGKAIDSLEDMLIALAYKRNNRLINTQKTAMLKYMEIAGYMNSSTKKPGPSARDFKKMFEVKAKKSVVNK